MPDLNVKKSWHPALAKNRARVKEKEQEALDQRRQQRDRQSEIDKQREIDELRSLQGETGSKLAWMYESKTSAPTNSDSNDDYLLGKKQIGVDLLQKGIDEAKENKKRRDQMKKAQLDPMASLLHKRKKKLSKHRKK